MPNDLTPGAPRVGAAGRPALHVVLPPERLPERQGLLAFFSSNERKGKWALPRKMRVATFMGSVVLDLREAEISYGVSEIEVFALFGNCEVYVPAGVRVEHMGDALAGNFELRMDGAPEIPPDAPIIRIRGMVYFSNVEAIVKGLSRRQLRAQKKLLGGG
jgi:hypothetical protein